MTRSLVGVLAILRLGLACSLFLFHGRSSDRLFEVRSHRVKRIVVVIRCRNVEN